MIYANYLTLFFTTEHIGVLESTLSFLSARPLPYWYTTKVRIIIDTTKFFNEKKNKKNMLFYLVD